MDRKLFRIATVVCFIMSVLFIGQITVFAEVLDENNTLLYEFNFDSGNDSDKVVYDSVTEKTIPLLFPNSTTNGLFVTGYNGIGKARHFDDSTGMMRIRGFIPPTGGKSISFKIKKDFSSISDKSEVIMTTCENGPVSEYGFYIGIGKTHNNTIPGILYISYCDSHINTQYNYELQTSKSICDGQWHDILFTWDGTTNINAVKLYVDDMKTPVAQTTAVHKEPKHGSILNIGGLIEGKIGLRPYTTNFVGNLDNIQIYAPNDTSNLKAVGGDSKVDLTWNAVTNATSYTVKRSTTAGGPYTTIATGVTGTTYTDKDVTNGTRYYYVVSAIVNGSESWSSNEASATPQASTDPDQPTGNKALLVISMVTGERKEYEMTLDKINDFIAWYNSKAASSPTYVIDKDYNKASFTARKDYIAYDQISNFEVNEYND